MSETRLRDLKGLRVKSEDALISAGIHSPRELREIGAVEAFIRMRDKGSIDPSLNFLYALVMGTRSRFIKIWARSFRGFC